MPIFKKKIVISFLILIIFYSLKNNAQDLVFYNSKVGFNFSTNLAFGTHFKRVGLTLNFFYVNQHFQANSELRAFFSFKNLGPKKIYKELIFAQGLVYGYDVKQKFFNPFINSISNQTGYTNSISYSFNAYFNKIKTTQQTGLIAIQIKDFSIITENDILARQTLDRFRTGAFLFQYQFQNIYQASINLTMWTGQMGNKKSIETTKIYSQCYMDTTNGVYSNFSHGLLSLQFKYNLGLSQNVQANIGVDAEQIRNSIQNKLIHDAVFLPKKIRSKKNCHIPMLDTTGNAYLFNPNQKIKKPKVYFNLFSGAGVFY